LETLNLIWQKTLVKNANAALLDVRLLLNPNLATGIIPPNCEWKCDSNIKKKLELVNSKTLAHQQDSFK
jgi:hypothetical protein